VLPLTPPRVLTLAPVRRLPPPGDGFVEAAVAVTERGEALVLSVEPAGADAVWADTPAPVQRDGHAWRIALIGPRTTRWHYVDGVHLDQPLIDRLPDGRLLLGRGFAWGERTGYVDLQLGWRQRFDAPPNELRTDLTVGVRPVPAWLLIAQAFGTFADGSARTPFTDASNVKAQLSAAYELAPGWTAQVGAFATVWGEDAAQEVGGLLSLWRAF
ncbi:MAG: hypothetical protein AAFU61_12165, partial [Pseudomonadota bacterium]